MSLVVHDAHRLTGNMPNMSIRGQGVPVGWSAVECSRDSRGPSRGPKSIPRTPTNHKAGFRRDSLFSYLQICGTGRGGAGIVALSVHAPYAVQPHLPTPPYTSSTNLAERRPSEECASAQWGRTEEAKGPNRRGRVVDLGRRRLRKGVSSLRARDGECDHVGMGAAAVPCAASVPHSMGVPKVILFV